MSKLYSQYLNTNHYINRLPDIHLYKGSFDQLLQYHGILFFRSKLNYIVNLLEWMNEYIHELSEFTGAGRRDAIMTNIYCHVLYICKSVYTLTITAYNNVPGNPDFKYQLIYYVR